MLEKVMSVVIDIFCFFRDLCNMENKKKDYEQLRGTSYQSSADEDDFSTLIFHNHVSYDSTLGQPKLAGPVQYH